MTSVIIFPGCFYPVSRACNVHQETEAYGPQSSSELQLQIAITCFLDWHDDSCMVRFEIKQFVDVYFYII